MILRVSVAVVKHHHQKQVREEKGYLAYTSTSLSIRESQGWDLKTELEQRL